MKKLTSRDWELLFYKKFCPVLYRKANGGLIHSSFLEHIEQQLKDKTSITIVLSGPSSKNLIIEDNTYFFTVNNSYRLVPDGSSFLYMLYDHFFTYRYLKVNNFIFNNTVLVIHPRTKFVKIKEWNNRLAQKALSICSKSKSTNKEFILSEFVDTNIHDLLIIEDFFYSKLHWDGEVYNTGILAAMLAAYFCEKLNIKLNIFGLDMGVGGRVHADTKKSVMHPNFLSDKNLQGVNNLLNAINALPFSFNNYSNFQPF